MDVAVAHEVSASLETWNRVLNNTVQHEVEFLAQVGERPVAPSAGAAQLRELLEGPLPDEPEDPTDVVSLLATAGQVSTMASAGPRFFGFVMGAAMPAAVGADWLVSA